MASDMQLMLDFCVGLIEAAADFLSGAPVIYLCGGFFGLICIKALKSLIHI